MASHGKPSRFEPTEFERYWLDRMPDEPQWIDFRGIVLTGRATTLGDENGCVILTPDFPGGSIVGRPPESALAKARRWKSLHTHEPSEMRIQPEDVEGVVDAFPGWRRSGAVLHRLDPARRETGRSVDAEIGLLEPGDRSALSHLPDDLRREISLALDLGWTTAAAWIDGAPVAFCCAALETEGLWDVAVETVSGYRRRGLAEACFRAVERVESERGRLPVWGAHDDNPASLALARRLGFVPVAQLTILIEPA